MAGGEAQIMPKTNGEAWSSSSQAHHGGQQPASAVSEKQRPRAGKLETQSKGLPAATKGPCAWGQVSVETGVSESCASPGMEQRWEAHVSVMAAGGAGCQGEAGAAVFITALCVCVGHCGQWWVCVCSLLGTHAQP